MRSVWRHPRRNIASLRDRSITTVIMFWGMGCRSLSVWWGEGTQRPRNRDGSRVGVGWVGWMRWMRWVRWVRWACGIPSEMSEDVRYSEERPLTHLFGTTATGRGGNRVASDNLSGDYHSSSNRCVLAGGTALFRLGQEYAIGKTPTSDRRESYIPHRKSIR